MNSHIVTIDEIYPDAAKLIAAAEQFGGWSPATTGMVGQPFIRDNIRRTNKILISATPSLKEWDEQLFGVFQNGIMKYCNTVRLDIGQVEDEGYTILKYGPGDFYKPHPDTVSSAQRDISAILFLNDEFEGGGVHFPRQDEWVTPKAGRLVFFPSYFTHVHEVVPVTAGVRYTVVTWFKIK